MKIPLLIPSAWILSIAIGSATVVFNDFSNTAGLDLNGSATVSGGALMLTAATNSSSGSAFTTAQEQLGASNSFSTYFQFQITASGGTSDTDGPGADGIVFVIQTVSSNVGSLGSGIGYQGINPSLGIEFDTYYNPGLGDPNGNHVGVNVNGSPTSLVTVVEPTRFNNGEIWNAWIDYQGSTGILEVRWSEDSTRPADASLSTTVNLAGILGQDTGYVGFTSGTGSAWGEHKILDWTYRSDFAPIPEPSALLLTAVAGSLIFRRRK